MLKHAQYSQESRSLFFAEMLSTAVWKSVDGLFYLFEDVDIIA